MTQWIAASWGWVLANPWTVVAIVVYLVVNLAPRPHPEKQTGWKKWFWLVVDRLSVLTADKVPGKLKMLFAGSPLVGPDKPQVDAKTTSKDDEEGKAKDVPKDEPKDKPEDEPKVEIDGPGGSTNQGKDGSGT